MTTLVAAWAHLIEEAARKLLEDEAVKFGDAEGGLYLQGAGSSLALYARVDDGELQATGIQLATDVLPLYGEVPERPETREIGGQEYRVWRISDVHAYTPPDYT